MSKMIFVNLPVTDLARVGRLLSKRSARPRTPQFCDDTAACMVFSDTIHAMLLTHDKYPPVHVEEDRRRARPRAKC